MITYTNRRGTSIGSLVDGRVYYVVALVDDDDTPTATSPSGSSSPRPSSRRSAPDSTRRQYHAGNVVDLIDQTGTPIPRDTNVREFAGATSTPPTDTIKLRGRAVSSTPSSSARPSSTTQGTAPIAGLVDGSTYYVAASTNQTNLQGNTRFADAQVIGLAETENEARGGVLIDIGADARATGYRLDGEARARLGLRDRRRHHRRARRARRRLVASAGLKSENANTNLWAKFKEMVGTNVPDLIFTKLTKALRRQPGGGERRRHEQRSASRARSPSSSPTTTSSPTSARHRRHQVERGPRGQGDDRAEAHAQRREQRRAAGELAGTSAATSADTMVSVAVSVGVVDNLATRHGRTGDATLDGLRATRVIADVSLPVPHALRPVHPALVGRVRRRDPQRGLRRGHQVPQHDARPQGLVLQHAGRPSTAKADELGIAGSVTVLVLTNTARRPSSRRREINQDLDWRTSRPPATTATSRARAPTPTALEGEQVVSIEATNYQQFINMVGIFSLPGHRPRREGHEVQGPHLAEPGRHRAARKGGVGGPFYIFVQNNTTHAIVEDGAKIYSGSDGGFNMKAEEAIFHIDLVQSGATGGEFAIAGSVAYIGQDSDTLVRLGATRSSTGRDVRLYAGNLTTQVTWVGAIAKGKGVGVGISVAINDLDRTTHAVIGDPDAVDEQRHGRDDRSQTSTSTGRRRRARQARRRPLGVHRRRRGLEPGDPQPTAARGHARAEGAHAARRRR